MRKKTCGECQIFSDGVETFNIISPWVYPGLAAYINNINSYVAHLKCCELKYARKFPLLTISKWCNQEKAYMVPSWLYCFARILLIIVHHTYDDLRCYQYWQKYARHLCRRPVLCINMMQLGKGCTVASWFRFSSAPRICRYQAQYAACRKMHETFPTKAGTQKW